MRLRLLAAAALTAIVLATPNLSAAEPTPRGAPHEGYGRMVFDWPEPVTFSASIDDGRLTVRFPKPLAGDARSLLRPLRDYVADVAVSEDGKEAVFRLRREVKLRSFTVGNSVVVDLLDAAGKAPDADAGPPALTVRRGQHDGFERLVFEWPHPVSYKLERDGDRVAMRFAGRATVDLEDLRQRLPDGMTVVEAGEDGRSTRVVFTLPASVKLRHFRSGNGVVLDVPRIPASADAPREASPAEEPPKPPAPPPSTQATPPAPQPPAPAKEAPAKAPTPAPAAPSANPPPATTEVRQGAPTLSFTWAQPAGAAVFRRAGWLWIVFDRTQPIDLAGLRRAGGPLVQHLEQIANPNATVLRLLVPPEYNPSLRRNGLTWLIDLVKQPLRPETALDVRAQAKAGNLFVPIPEGGGSVRLVDPEVGDTMTVVPVLPLGHGIYPDYQYPELDLPATAQGIVIVPHADGVGVQSTRTGIGIDRPQGGLHLSEVAPQRMAAVQLGTRAATSPVLDVAGWARGGDRQAYLQKLANSGDQRNGARLDLARYQAGNGYGAEALGILRTMLTEDPQAVDTQAYRAVRGIANFLMHRYADAAEDFGHESLRGVPEAAAWRAAALASLSDGKPDLADLNAGLALSTSYPAPLKKAFGWAALEANLDAGDHQTARLILDALAAEPLTAAGQAKLAYYQGRYHALVGEFDTAVEKWSEAEGGNDRLYRALASRDRVELLLKQDKMTRKEAIDALDRLRFAWREPEFEFSLLKRLGELEIADGEYSDGLRTLKQLVSLYGQHPGIREVAQTMSDTFAKLYLDGAADALPPVTAIALYDEFRELTPTGSRGDEMIRRLADRLVAVDLLDRAADLLKHQVEFRLSGVEKARVGAQLAVVRLLDRKPEQALQSLKASEVPDAPPELKRQRGYLQVRALDDMGQNDAALALLAGDQSATARLLRAEIHWRARDWAAAATDFEGLVGNPPAGGKLDDMTARFVLHWATALTLAQDDGGLDKLRKRFDGSMTTTAYADAFGLLTSAPKTETIDQKTIAARIQDAEKFQSFLASYRDRLRTQGLSALN